MENNETEKSNILYISNFPKRIERTELQKILSEYGPLISLNIIQKNDFSFAFAEYDDIRDAAFAVKELNQKFFYGMNLKVQYKNKKIKSKETIQSEQQKSKCNTLKNSNSPRSNPEINCNLHNSITQDRKKQQQKSEYRSPRETSKNRRQNSSQISDFSLSPSRSRSREKGKRARQSGYINNRRPYCKQNYRYRDRSIEKEREKRSNKQHQDYSEIGQMLQMLKYFNKNLKRLQRKIQDFIYDHQNDDGLANRKRI